MALVQPSWPTVTGARGNGGPFAALVAETARPARIVSVGVNVVLASGISAHTTPR